MHMHDKAFGIQWLRRYGPWIADGLFVMMMALGLAIKVLGLQLEPGIGLFLGYVGAHITVASTRVRHLFQVQSTEALWGEILTIVLLAHILFGILIW
jgi:hypothetical protein